MKSTTASIKVCTPLHTTVKAGLYLVNSLGALSPYRVSATGASWYSCPNLAEAERLATHLGHETVNREVDSIAQ